MFSAVLATLLRRPFLIPLVASLVALGGCGGSSNRAAPDLGPTFTPPPANFDQISAPTATCEHGWLFTQVPRQGHHPQFARAADGTLHLLYLGQGVANAGESAWRHVGAATPLAAETLPLQANAASIAVASDGTPTVFMSEPGEGIVRLYEDARGWQRDPVAFGYDSGGDAPLATFDAAGHADVAFRAGGQLYYGTDAGGSWTLTTVGDQRQSSPWALLGDPSGALHLFFTGNDAQTQVETNYWASNAGGRWQAIAFPPNVWGVNSAVDRSGRPHLLHPSASGPLHWWYEQGAWQQETLPFVMSGAYDFLFDAGDHMHLLLATSQSLVYATNATGSWTQSTITQLAPSTGSSGRLALDASGRPRVAFSWTVAGMDPGLFAFAQPCP
ncbi:MAG: hypothetical protein JWN44_6001 [Myxococcales bacterium]|nr:hypothetical protein [Myxococcales bacterium]